jgi:hypothetical protein
LDQHGCRDRALELVEAADLRAQPPWITRTRRRIQLTEDLLDARMELLRAARAEVLTQSSGLHADEHERVQKEQRERDDAGSRPEPGLPGNRDPDGQEHRAMGATPLAREPSAPGFRCKEISSSMGQGNDTLTLRGVVGA